jgi:hypothetical protein
MIHETNGSHLKSRTVDTQKVVEFFRELLNLRAIKTIEPDSFDPGLMASPQFWTIHFPANQDNGRAWSQSHRAFSVNLKSFLMIGRRSAILTYY